MRKNICKCGHSESDHANHYEYHQCYILGCECLNFEAAQQHEFPADVLDGDGVLPEPPRQ